MSTNSKDKILDLLSTHLGVDRDDVAEDDSFREDLHMNAVEIADFASVLEKNDLVISPEELTKLTTVGELLEFFETDEDIS